MADWKLPQRYRVRYIPRDWVGKPGFQRMETFVYSDDPSWAHDYATKLKLNGCGRILIEVKDE